VLELRCCEVAPRKPLARDVSGDLAQMGSDDGGLSFTNDEVAFCITTYPDSC
jgi:hypothetical protein